MFFAFMNIFKFFNKENNISIEKSIKNYINKDFEVLQYLSLGFTKTQNLYLHVSLMGKN